MKIYMNILAVCFLLLSSASYGTEKEATTETPKKPSIGEFYVLKQGALKEHAEIRELPFPQLTERPQRKVTIIEGSYALTSRLNYPHFIVGPLRPCSVIIIRDLGSGQMLIAHKDHASSLQSLGEVCKKEFKKEAFPQLSIIIYTHKMADANYQRFLPHYENRSQTQEVKHTKDFFVALFDIPRSQVKGLLFDEAVDGDLVMKNMLLTYYLCISREGTIYCIDPFDTDLWGWRAGTPWKKALTQKLGGHLDPFLQVNVHLFGDIAHDLRLEALKKLRGSGRFGYGSKAFYSQEMIDDLEKKEFESKNGKVKSPPQA